MPAPATEEEGVALVMRARVNWSGVELVFSGRKRGEGVRPRCEPAGPPQTRQAGEPAGAESAACFSFLFSFYLYIKKYLDGRGGTIEAKAIDRAALQLRAVEK